MFEWGLLLHVKIAHMCKVVIAAKNTDPIKDYGVCCHIFFSNFWWKPPGLQTLDLKSYFSWISDFGLESSSSTDFRHLCTQLHFTHTFKQLRCGCFFLFKFCNFNSMQHLKKIHTLNHVIRCRKSPKNFRLTLTASSGHPAWFQLASLSDNFGPSRHFPLFCHSTFLNFHIISRRSACDVFGDSLYR